MPAIFPLFAIVAVFVFISIHASTNPPRRRRYDSGAYGSGGGRRDSRGSRDYASYDSRSEGGRDRRSSGGGRDNRRSSDRSRY